MIRLILLVAALICFVAAAIDIHLGSIGLVPAGLALWVLGDLVGVGGTKVP